MSVEDNSLNCSLNPVSGLFEGSWAALNYCLLLFYMRTPKEGIEEATMFLHSMGFVAFVVPCLPLDEFMVGAHMQADHH